MSLGEGSTIEQIKKGKKETLTLPELVQEATDLKFMFRILLDRMQIHKEYTKNAPAPQTGHNHSHSAHPKTQSTCPKSSKEKNDKIERLQSELLHFSKLNSDLEDQNETLNKEIEELRHRATMQTRQMQIL